MVKVVEAEDCPVDLGSALIGAGGEIEGGSPS